MVELISSFLRLGFTAFGGPAAHIALMQQEFVVRRKWLSSEEFLDLLGAASLIPGPSSSELAIFLGYRRAGLIGLAVAGICFILPAALIVGAIAWAYVRFGTLPAVSHILYGIKPVVIAVVLQAVWGLGKTAVKSRFLALLACGAAVAGTFDVTIPLVLLAAGLVSMGAKVSTKKRGLAAVLAPLLYLCARPQTAVAAAVSGKSLPVGLGRIFLFFLKIGSIQFGSGYVLLAFLRADLVTRWHWLTEGQLLDAIAVGQFTPGPVFTTATFIGYVLHSTSGAIVATVGIFLPAFILVAASGAYIARLRKSQAASAFLDGVNVASLALMAVVTWQLGRGSLVDLTTVAIALVSALLLLRWRLNSAWLIGAGGLIGFLAHAGAM